MHNKELHQKLMGTRINEEIAKTSHSEDSSNYCSSSQEVPQGQLDHMLALMKVCSCTFHSADIYGGNCLSNCRKSKSSQNFLEHQYDE
jgi:hypothetical protein